MEIGFLLSAFGLYYLSLNDSSFRTFSAAPCLGRFEPNAPAGGGGGDMNDTLFFKSIQSDRLLITLWICEYLVVFVEMLVSINGDKEELIN